MTTAKSRLRFPTMDCYQILSTGLLTPSSLGSLTFKSAGVGTDFNSVCPKVLAHLLSVLPLMKIDLLTFLVMNDANIVMHLKLQNVFR